MLTKLDLEHRNTICRLERKIAIHEGHQEYFQAEFFARMVSRIVKLYKGGLR